MAQPTLFGKIIGMHQPRGCVREIIALELERGNPDRQLLKIFVGRFEYVQPPAAAVVYAQ